MFIVIPVKTGIFFLYGVFFEEIPTYARMTREQESLSCVIYSMKDFRLKVFFVLNDHITSRFCPKEALFLCYFRLIKMTYFIQKAKIIQLYFNILCSSLYPRISWSTLSFESKLLIVIEKSFLFR